MTDTSKTPRKITVKEWATKWGVSTMSVYRWIKHGRLNATRVGNCWRLDETATVK